MRYSDVTIFIIIITFILSVIVIPKIIQLTLEESEIRITAKKIVEGFILFVAVPSCFVWLLSTGYVSFVKNHAVVSCPIDEAYGYCADEFHAYMDETKDINLSEEINTAYRRHLELTGEQKRKVQALACTTPEKSLTLSVQHARHDRFYGVDAPGVQQTVIDHLFIADSNGTRYVAFKNDNSPESIKSDILKRFDSLIYSISWQAQDGGWVNYTSYQGWDELLTQEAKANNTPHRLTISGMTETITCSN